jgi:hypothetical protein
VVLGAKEIRREWVRTKIMLRRIEKIKYGIMIDFTVRILVLLG